MQSLDFLGSKGMYSSHVCCSWGGKHDNTVFSTMKVSKTKFDLANGNYRQGLQFPRSNSATKKVCLFPTRGKIKCWQPSNLETRLLHKIFDGPLKFFGALSATFRHGSLDNGKHTFEAVYVKAGMVHEVMRWRQYWWVTDRQWHCSRHYISAYIGMFSPMFTESASCASCFLGVCRAVSMARL
jgi:hypothetical protein